MPPRPFLALVPVLLGAALTAQMPEVVIRATTRLVQVNVIVTKNGEPVRDLKKEDFQVFDNGKKQEIRQFSEDTRALLPASSEKLPAGTFTNQLEQRSGTPAAVTAILLDGVNTSFQDQSYARLQVIRFLKQIQPEDRIAIYTLDSHGLRVLHNYTTDSSDLVAKLNQYTGDVMPDVTGQSEVNTMLGAWMRGDSFQREYFLNQRITATLKAIEYIADNLATLPGRKNLIWVSAAFPLQIGYLTNPRPASSSSTYAASQGTPQSRGAGVFKVPNPPRAQRTWTTEMDNTVRAVNNANLAIYPVDARGLVASASSRIGSRLAASQGTMEEIAGRTGGRAFINNNDIENAVRTAVEDSSDTYTLGFYPQNDKFDNSFHTIKVKLPELSHVELRYRKGYMDQTAPPQDEKLRRAELADAVYSPMDANGIGLRAMVRRTGAGFDVTTRIDPHSILLDPQGDRWVGQLDLLFVEKDAHGQQVSGLDASISLALEQKTYEKVQSEGLLYNRVIPIVPQASELRVVARDAATAATGSITVPVSDIPPDPR